MAKLHRVGTPAERFKAIEKPSPTPSHEEAVELAQSKVDALVRAVGEREPVAAAQSGDVAPELQRAVEPQPEAQPVPEPAPGSEPALQPAPEPEPTLQPAPKLQQQPEPEPEPAPQPEPELQQQPEPKPAPQPEPSQQPETELQQQPVLEPEPTPAPQPAEDADTAEIEREREALSEKRTRKHRKSKPASKGVIRFATICSAIAFACFGAVTAYAYFDTNTVSQSENRNLATAQTLSESTWADGSFMTGTESFLSDHLFDRSRLITLAQGFDGLIERYTEVKVETGAGLNDNTTDANDAYSQAQIQEAGDQKYVVLDDRVVATYQHNEPTVEYFETAASTLFNAVPADVQKYLMVVPSRVSFETDEVKAQSDDPKDDIYSIYKTMPASVTTVDAYAALEAHSSEYIYFRTDHHWTELGAYYGAQALFDAAGVSYIPIEQYEQRAGTSFLGYLYANFPSATMQQHPDDLTYYVYNDDIKDETVTVTEGTGKYSTVTGKVIDTSRGGYYSFVQTSFSEAVIEGNASSDRVIMVVSDSYMQTLAPWLADNYAKVILIDPRYYKDGSTGLNSLIDQYGVTDFLLLQSSLNLPYATFSTLLIQLGS